MAHIVIKVDYFILFFDKEILYITSECFFGNVASIMERLETWKKGTRRDHLKKAKVVRKFH